MDAIAEYQKWKQQGESLRTQAKEAMETKFRDLLLEAARIAQEYQRDFATTLKPPAGITAFRFKTASSAKSKKTAKAAPVKRQETAAPAPPNPKIAALQKRRAQIGKRLESAKAAGKPTKNIEDALYEIEDELRLAGNAA
jgi:hypothetical protein